MAELILNYKLEKRKTKNCEFNYFVVLNVVNNS